MEAAQELRGANQCDSKEKMSEGLEEQRSRLQANSFDKQVYEEMEVDLLQWDDQEDDTPPLASHDCKEEGCVFASTPALMEHALKPQTSDEALDCDHGSAETFIRRRRQLKRGKSPFDSLSDETKLLIFSYLTKAMLCKCATVCKDWKRICYDESLWASVSMSGLPLTSDGTVGTILERGVRIMRLAKSQIFGNIFSEESSSRQQRLRRRRKNKDSLPLEYLDASLCTFHNGTLSQLLLSCKRLRKLSLEACQLSEAAARGISNNTQLETLNLCMCRGITSAVVESIAENCPKLESLNISWTDMELDAVRKDSSWRWTTRNWLSAALCNQIKSLLGGMMPEILPVPVAVSYLAMVCTRMPTLKFLNISGYRMDMTDDCLKKLVQTCRFLKHLDISDSPLLGAETLRYIAESTELESLAISRCFGIPPTDVSHLGELKSLRELQIYGFLNSDGLARLTRLCPNLDINSHMFSSVARPCSGVYKGKIWGLPCCMK